MNQSYKIVTTNLGRTAVRLALTQGENVRLTHMAVGDGGGQEIEPVSSMTGLVRETYRAQINDIVFDAAAPDMFTAELFIPQSVGGFYIREVGLFMEDGTLFAIGSMPLTEKPELSSGSASDLLIKIIVRVLDASTISISIDPAQVLATRDYVDRMDRDRIRAAVEAHDKEQAAHDCLARKTIQIKTGTGLSGGGTLEADRTLTVKYGNTPGTACQGDDSRLKDTRIPKAHASATTTYGAASETQYGHAKASATTPKAAGTASPGTETDAFARGDHVHPVQSTITGNAGTATKLATPRTIALSGDATASGAFDGSGNLTLAATLKNSGATAGSYGPGANATPAFGASFEVPEVTVDAKGRVTSIAERTVKLPAAPTSVTGNAGTATKWATKRTIDGVQADGSTNIHHYVTCSTAAATAEKAVTQAGFVLATGARITVRFTVTNTAANPTLNVSGTGAKAIRYRNAAISAGYLAANRTYDFVYDGTYYQFIGDIDTNTTYAAATVAPKAAGTAAVGTSTKYAREDHVHPAQTTVSGNAGTATKWATKRTLDGVQVDGSANIHHYGTCSTVAATVEKAVTLAGFVLATGARVTVRFTVTNTAANPTLNVNGTGAKAIRYRNAAISAGYLATNRTYDFIYDGSCYQLIGDIDTNTTYTVATQTKNGLFAAADKKAVDYGEAFRLSMIGVPRFWRSTTLPAGHVWANGDLALFADWPELKKVYDGGGFNGMLLAYNANAATIAANLGKWRPNAANPTGLYVPNISEQFFRAWTGVGQAGLRVTDMGRNLTASWTTGWVTHFIPTVLTSGAAFTANEMAFEASTEPGQKVNQPFHVGIDAGRIWGTEHVGTEFAPTHVQLPAILYLGLSA